MLNNKILEFLKGHKPFFIKLIFVFIIIITLIIYINSAYTIGSVNFNYISNTTQNLNYIKDRGYTTHSLTINLEITNYTNSKINIYSKDFALNGNVEAISLLDKDTYLDSLSILPMEKKVFDVYFYPYDMSSTSKVNLVINSTYNKNKTQYTIK